MNDSELLLKALEALSSTLFVVDATVHNLSILDLDRSEYRIIEEPNSDQKSLPLGEESNVNNSRF